MKYQRTNAGGPGSSARKPTIEVGVRLFRHIHQKLAVALLLVSFNGLPARCQDAGNLASWRAADAPGVHLERNVCILLRRELCSESTLTDPKSTQKQSSGSAIKKTVRRFGKDQKEIYLAPFHVPNLKWDVLFLAGTGILIATDRQASRAMPGNHVDISRNISTAGLAGTSAAAGILWFTGMTTHNDHARETGALSAEALANAAPVYVGLQLLTGRERPIEGTGNGRFWRNNALNSSFPSGHALFTWSMASVIAHEYPRPWVKWLAYGTATAVSLARFTGREHFPSDVAVGSLFGYLIGRHIFNAHCKEGLSEGCRSRKIVVAN
jgi:membrane-associated phospholipid phosphatase